MRVPFATFSARLEEDDASAISSSSSDTSSTATLPARSSPALQPTSHLSRQLSEPLPASPHLDPSIPPAHHEEVHWGRRPSNHSRPSDGESSRHGLSSIYGSEDAGPSSRRSSLPSIPTYDEALAAGFPDSDYSAAAPAALHLSAYHAPEADQPLLSGITTYDDDEDDPFVPRIRRAPPELGQRRPLRRFTMAGVPRTTSPMPEEDENEDEEAGDQDGGEEAESGEGEQAVNRSQLDPLTGAQMPLVLPPPPADALPSYSAHLARDELRLISTVHLDQNHPAAAFFSAMTASAISANPLASPPPATDEHTTGGKKLKVTITSGGERMNDNGPLFIRLGREGVVEGKIAVGKVDHATSLEVSIIGLVNTSYYVRGQYTLIDTMPLARRQVILYPPPAPQSAATETQANGESSQTNGDPPASSTDTSTATTTATTTTGANADTSTPQANGTPVTPTSNGTTGPSAQPSTSPSTGTVRPITPAVRSASAAPTTHVVSSEGAHGEMIDPGTPYDPSTERNNPVKNFDFRHFKKIEPVIEDFVPQGSAYSFSLRMPAHYFRDENVPLPPSAQIFQVGMQAAVEYVLRVKLTRKGWRLNEAIGVPIIYEPRAFVTPRRLRALTTDDALNPGWRTIKLHGGTPVKATEDAPTPPTVGVETTLLLPSPPILYVPADQPPPPIPFHLHFHSPSTLPLATFSDPNECHFIIRLMRVASMRIGTEREMRRVEIPSQVEIWQEGGPHLTLGEDARPDATPAAVRPTPSRSGTANSTSGTSPSTRRKSFSDRRPSFLRRKTSSTSTSPTTPTVSGTPGEPAIAEEPAPEEPPPPPSVLTPLSLDATDVHLLGQLTLKLPDQGPLLFRTLVQSFMTPEIGVTYVLEVGLQPKKGAVKEAFNHVWGGGLIEVVLGPRREGDRTMRTGMVVATATTE